MNESQLVREICDWLHENDYFFWRENNVPTPVGVYGMSRMRALPKYTPRGIADIIVVLSGRIYAIEVKRGGSEDERERNGRKVRAGKISPEQAEWGAKLVMHGGRYACVRSLQEVKDFLGV
jgi:hypothetical protein